MTLCLNAGFPAPKLCNKAQTQPCIVYLQSILLAGLLWNTFWCSF